MGSLENARHFVEVVTTKFLYFAEGLQILCLFDTVSDNRDSSIKSTEFHPVVSLETVSVVPATSAAPRAFP